MTDPTPVPDAAHETPAHEDDLDEESLADDLDTDPETPAHPEGDVVADDESPE